MSLLIYNLLLPLLMVLYVPVFILKMLRRGNYAHHFGERFGFFSTTQRAALKRLRAPVWVHAVSVGEVVAALTFIRRWQQRQPELEFVLSTTTTTGQAMAQAKLPERVKLIYCPLDLPMCVRTALRLIRPRMLVIFEVEVWPNLITMARRCGATVVLVNGRMSDRSAAGYAKHRWFFKPLFSRFAALCVQSDEDGVRLRRVVGDDAPVHVCNTMKFDQVPDSAGQDKSALLNDVFGPGERLLWTVGSTHPGEEALALQAFKALRPQFPTLKLVLVPRHHERTAEIEALLRAESITYRLLKTAAPATETALADVLLVNTTGELMGFYGVADITYVGKSLAGNHGGHNIIEPAIFGKPVLHGVNMENFRAVVDIFRKHDAAIELAQDADLLPALQRLAASAELRRELGQRARRVVEQYRGAIDRTLDVVIPLTVER